MVPSCCYDALYQVGSCRSNERGAPLTLKLKLQRGLGFERWWHAATPRYASFVFVQYAKIKTNGIQILFRGRGDAPCVSGSTTV
jgi:hypothetical protein